MTRAPIGDATTYQVVNDVLAAWMLEWQAASLPGRTEHIPEPDDRGHFHWLVRLRGEEKDYITIWFSLRQRTVHVETQVMPAPEENAEDLYRFLLKKNAELREVHLAIGPEEGIYLVTQIPFGELTRERLDETIGAVVAYTEEIFPTGMSIGLASLYRRKKRP